MSTWYFIVIFLHNLFCGVLLLFLLDVFVFIYKSLCLSVCLYTCVSVCVCVGVGVCVKKENSNIKMYVSFFTMSDVENKIAFSILMNY